jgi:hypothetical protein
MSTSILTDKLTDMAMHESKDVDSETRVMRVPNGLLYITVVRTGGGGTGSLLHKAVTSTFVPLHSPSLKAYNT